MKKIFGISIAILAAGTALTGCAGWDTVATVGGGTGWYAGDYAPYYWSNWNTPSNPPVVGNGPGSIVSSGWNNTPSAPPAVGNGPGSVNPGRPGRPGNGNPNPNPNPGNNGGPNFAPGAPNNAPTAPPSTGNGPGSNPGNPSQGGFRGQK